MASVCDSPSDVSSSDNCWFVSIKATSKASRGPPPESDQRLRPDSVNRRADVFSGMTNVCHNRGSSRSPSLKVARPPATETAPRTLQPKAGLLASLIAKSPFWIPTGTSDKSPSSIHGPASGRASPVVCVGAGTGIVGELPSSPERSSSLVEPDGRPAVIVCVAEASRSAAIGAVVATTLKFGITGCTPSRTDS